MVFLVVESEWRAASVAVLGFPEKELSYQDLSALNDPQARFVSQTFSLLEQTVAAQNGQHVESANLLRNIVDSPYVQSDKWYGRLDGRMVDYPKDPDGALVHGLSYLLLMRPENPSVASEIVRFATNSLVAMGRYDVLGQREYWDKLMHLASYYSPTGADSQVLWSAVEDWLADMQETVGSDALALHTVKTGPPEKKARVFHEVFDVFESLAGLSVSQTGSDRERHVVSLMKSPLIRESDGVLRMNRRVSTQDKTWLQHARMFLLSFPSMDVPMIETMIGVAKSAPAVGRSDVGHLPAYVQLAVARAAPRVRTDQSEYGSLQRLADATVRSGWPAPPTARHDAYIPQLLGDKLRLYIYAMRCATEGWDMPDLRALPPLTQERLKLIHQGRHPGWDAPLWRDPGSGKLFTAAGAEVPEPKTVLETVSNETDLPSGLSLLIGLLGRLREYLHKRSQSTQAKLELDSSE